MAKSGKYNFKTKTYAYGPYSMKTYMKPAGSGWEVGMTCAGKSYFMGNFVHTAEANRWWGMINREIRTFAKKYWVSDAVNFTWYCGFLSKHLYASYYTFLDKMFTKYNKNYYSAYNKEVKKYNRYKKTWDKSDKYYFHSKAA